MLERERAGARELERGLELERALESERAGARELERGLELEQES